MIKTYATEFVKIVEYLSKQEGMERKGKFIMPDKKTVVKMLDRNAYDTADNKLKIWKSLNWISTDDKRFTSRLTRDGVTFPVIKISLTVYETLKNLV